MIDIEFIVQYLVLEYSREYPELTDNFGNIALLKMSEKLNLIPEEAGEKVSAIYRQFRKRQHEIRMQGADQAKVEPDEVTDQVNEVKNCGIWFFCIRQMKRTDKKTLKEPPFYGSFR